MYSQVVSQTVIKRPITLNMFDLKLSQLFPGFESGELLFFPNQEVIDEKLCIDYQKERKKTSTWKQRRKEYKSNEKKFLDMVNN